MSEQTGARTGALVQALADGVAADLSDIIGDLDAVRAKFMALGESAKAINGLGGDCSGWADRLLTMANEVQKEHDEVPAKLLGKRKAEVITHVNPELADKAKNARSAA